MIRILVIVGPTASGKSDLALKIAKRFNGEIIAADSRTVYKDMDIGTAKPSRADQTEVKHWGLDLAKPGQRFTVYRFKRYAQDAILDIQNRQKLPILVGGTGLYTDSVVFNFSFRPSNRLDDRPIYLNMSVEELQKIIKQKNYLMPENRQNKRHLIRTIETAGILPIKNSEPLARSLIVGLWPKNEALKNTISKRVETMFKQGVTGETEALLKHYGQGVLDSNGGLIYKICLRLLKGEITESEAREMAKTADWQYARRQRTWFRRNPYIKWFDSPEAAYSYIKEVL